MRFDAKFTAAFAATVFGGSLLHVGATTASETTPITGSHSIQTESESTKKAPKTHEAKKSTASDKKKSTESKPKHKTVTVKAGDSLSSIAESHDTTWVRLFNANKSVANPDQLEPGKKLTIPTAKEKLPNRYEKLQAAAVNVAPAPAATTTAAPETYTTKNYSSAPVTSDSYYVGNGMWCTDYVHQKRPDVPIYGNAGYSWVNSARADGKSVGSTPRAGAVAVTNGHVAYVEHVNKDGSYTVSEMGWNYQAGNYNKRTAHSGDFGKFIYK